MEKIIFNDIFKSPIGTLFIEADSNFLLSVSFSKKIKIQKNKITKMAIIQLKEYFCGERKKFDIPLKISGSHFQQKCWSELSNINFGTTISYKEQAMKLGGVNYSRAVAGANNKNKFLIIIPCHRVIGSNGALVGYAGGLVAKSYLLNHEKKNLTT